MLNQLNPSAAASLTEGLEETLTLHDLQVHARLRRSLSSSNGIESSFSVVETICRRVKRWQGGDYRLRWGASALLYAEMRWNRLHGYRHLPLLIHNLQRAYEIPRNLKCHHLRCQLGGLDRVSQPFLFQRKGGHRPRRMRTMEV